MEKITGLGIDTPRIGGDKHAFTSSKFELQRTSPLHLDGDEKVQQVEQPDSFKDLLLGSLDKASNIMDEPGKLALQSIIDPASVSAHDISIATKKAEQTISITAGVINRALEAYRTIIALR